MKSKKIKELKEELLNNKKNYTHYYLIINLLETRILEELINKLNNKKTKIKTIENKKHLTPEQQFLYLLNHFICLFKDNFYFLQNNIDNIISIILQNNKCTKYLLSKKYIGNNKNIPYFSYNIKRLITYNYYYNLIYLEPKSNKIKQYIKYTELNLRKNSINNPKNLEKIYNNLLELAFCNTKTLNNIILFENIRNYKKSLKQNNNIKNNNIDELVNQYYIINLEIMIQNYYQKKEAINILLK